MTSSINYRPDDRFGWREGAACAKPGAPLMDPSDSDVVGVDRAKAWCRRCPVAGECLREALDRREPYGIWGGTTGTEREDMLRRARARLKGSKVKK